MSAFKQKFYKNHSRELSTENGGKRQKSVKNASKKRQKCVKKSFDGKWGKASKNGLPQRLPSTIGPNPTKHDFHNFHNFHNFTQISNIFLQIYEKLILPNFYEYL
jgi:hypothetical protein